MKKVVLILVSLYLMVAAGESYAARDSAQWGSNTYVYGLIPYYKESNEVWLVLGLYSYDNGQQGLSAAIEYTSLELFDLHIYGDYLDFFKQKCASAGINQDVKQIFSLVRMPTFSGYFVEISKSDVVKLQKIKLKDLVRFEPIKFSDLYNAVCSESHPLLSPCTIAGKPRLFLSSFVWSYLDKRFIDSLKNELRIASVPVYTQVAPQPTTTPSPTSITVQPFKGLVVVQPKFTSVQEWSQKNLSSLVPYYMGSDGEVRLVLGYYDPYGDQTGGVSSALVETDQDMETVARDQGYINHFGPIRKAGSFNSNGAKYDLYVVEVVDTSKIAPANLVGTTNHERLSDFVSKLGAVSASDPLIMKPSGMFPVFKNFAGAVVASKDSFKPASVPVSTQPTTPTLQTALQELSVRLNDLGVNILKIH